MSAEEHDWHVHSWRKNTVRLVLVLCRVFLLWKFLHYEKRNCVTWKNKIDISNFNLEYEALWQILVVIWLCRLSSWLTAAAAFRKVSSTFSIMISLSFGIRNLNWHIPLCSEVPFGFCAQKWVLWGCIRKKIGTHINILSQYLAVIIFLLKFFFENLGVLVNFLKNCWLFPLPIFCRC